MSCLILYHDMRVQYVCNHGIRFPGRFFFDYLNSDSIRVSSQVLIMCHDNTIIPNVCENTHNIKFHVSRNKTQDMHTKTQTWEISQSNQSRTTSTFLHDVSLRSVSNSKF